MEPYVHILVFLCFVISNILQFRGIVPVPLTRSSMTWDNTLTTVMFPIRANAIEAVDRMKSPTKMAWNKLKKKNHTFILSLKKAFCSKTASRIFFHLSLTFFSPHTSLIVLFPRRLSDPSMTSSCTRLAVWIISEIMATAFCPGSKSLRAIKVMPRLQEEEWN